MQDSPTFPERLKYQDAMLKGYCALTRPYAINNKIDEIRERETKWFHNVLNDMHNANVVIVEFSSGVEVWRHKSELNIDSMGRQLAGRSYLNTQGTSATIRPRKSQKP